MRTIGYEIQSAIFAKSWGFSMEMVFSDRVVRDGAIRMAMFIFPLSRMDLRLFAFPKTGLFRTSR